jgi:NADPH-dependent 2,4-dienoyl-CoA reductase/sulfur reductase-like enzyme
MKVVVIGCMNAGASAALGVAALHRDAGVTVYERNGGILCQFEIKGLKGGALKPLWTNAQPHHKQPIDSELAFPSGGTTPPGLSVKAGHEVTAVDFGARMLKIRNIGTGEITYDVYDKLIIATGSMPDESQIEKIENAGLKNIFISKNYDDAEEIMSKISKSGKNAQNSQKIAVIGAGLAGVRLAAAFRALGMGVVLIDREKRILRERLDAPFSEGMMRLLAERGVKLALGDRARAFKGDLNGRVSAVVTDAGDYEAGLAVLCAGRRPDTGIFKGKLEMLENGAIRTDRYTRASAPDVFAAGDAAAVWNNALKAHDYVPLAANAVRMGALAARNLKSNVTKHPGTQSTIVAEICGVHIASTGLTEASAARAGMDALTASFPDCRCQGFMPSRGETAVRLVYEGGSRRLLGGQIMSDASAAEAINTISACIQKEMTIDELAFADFSFHPHSGEPRNFLNALSGAASLALPPLFTS